MQGYQARPRFYARDYVNLHSSFRTDKFNRDAFYWMNVSPDISGLYALVPVMSPASSVWFHHRVRAFYTCYIARLQFLLISGSPTQISCLCLHPIIDIHEPSLWSSTSPPAWQLHIQHPLSLLCTRPNRLSLGSLCLQSTWRDASCSHNTSTFLLFIYQSFMTAVATGTLLLDNSIEACHW